MPTVRTTHNQPMMTYFTAVEFPGSQVHKVTVWDRQCAVWFHIVLWQSTTHCSRAVLSEIYSCTDKSPFNVTSVRMILTCCWRRFS